MRVLNMSLTPAQRSTVVAFFLGFTVVVSCLFVGSTVEAKVVTFALFILGMALGWLFGTIATPYNRSEEQLFAKYVTMITTFVSGFLVAKADPIINELFKIGTFSDPLVMFRVIAFSVAFVLSLIVVFIYRMYVFSVSGDTNLQVDAKAKP